MYNKYFQFNYGIGVICYLCSTYIIFTLNKHDTYKSHYDTFVSFLNSFSTNLARKQQA